MYYIIRFKNEFIKEANNGLMEYCEDINPSYLLDGGVSSMVDELTTGYTTRVDPIKYQKSSFNEDNQIYNIYAVTENTDLIKAFKSMRRHKYFSIEKYKTKPKFMRYVREDDYELQFMTYEGVEILSNLNEYDIFHGVIDYIIPDAVTLILSHNYTVPICIMTDELQTALDAIHFTNIAGFSEYGFGVDGFMTGEDAIEEITQNRGYGLSPMGTMYSSLYADSFQLYVRVLGFSIKKGIIK